MTKNTQQNHSSSYSYRCSQQNSGSRIQFQVSIDALKKLAATLKASMIIPLSTNYCCTHRASNHHINNYNDKPHTIAIPSQHKSITYSWLYPLPNYLTPSLPQLPLPYILDSPHPKPQTSTTPPPAHHSTYSPPPTLAQTQKLHPTPAPSPSH